VSRTFLGHRRSKTEVPLTEIQEVKKEKDMFSQAISNNAGNLKSSTPAFQNIFSDRGPLIITGNETTARVGKSLSREEQGWLYESIRYEIVRMSGK